MNIFGRNLNLGLSNPKKFISNPVNVLIVVAVLFVAWKLYQSYSEGFASEKSATVVLFHLPTCGFCKDMMPEWNKFQKAHASDPNTNVQKVDCSQNPEAAEKNGISGFPTIIKFLGDKKIVYDGERTAEALEGFLRN